VANLFQPIELASLLQRDVQSGGAYAAEEIAATWLRSATGLPTFPDPLPDDLHAWGLELAALIYNSFTPTDGRTSPVDPAAKARILTAAGQAYGPTGAGSGGPQGCFPTALSYPDPAVAARFYDTAVGAWVTE
jgi:hypothetical protein